MTVSTVVQHHEGAGAPRTVDLSAAGYSAGIFDAGKWAIWRQPDDPRGPGYHDFGTAGFNGTVASVVLTGDRDNYPVTDADRQAMRELAAEFRRRGWLVDQPNVFSHRQMPLPNQTECAGFHVGPAVPTKGLAGDNLVWLSVVACYHKTAVLPPLPKVSPTMWPPIDNVVDAVAISDAQPLLVTVDGHFYCPKGGYQGSPYHDDGSPRAYWKLPDGTVRNVASVAASGGYVIVTATTGEKYGPDFNVG